MLKNGATASFFEYSQIDTYRKMNNWMTSQPDVLTSNSNDGIERVKNGTNYKSVFRKTDINFKSVMFTTRERVVTQGFQVTHYKAAK